MASPVAKGGIPKLNLSGVPSGGGWALGEQVQLVPSMAQQQAQGMQVYEKKVESTTAEGKKSNNSNNNGGSTTTITAASPASSPPPAATAGGSGDKSKTANQAAVADTATKQNNPLKTEEQQQQLGDGEKNTAAIPVISNNSTTNSKVKNSSTAPAPAPAAVAGGMTQQLPPQPPRQQQPQPLPPVATAVAPPPPPPPPRHHHQHHHQQQQQHAPQAGTPGGASSSGSSDIMANSNSQHQHHIHSTVGKSVGHLPSNYRSSVSPSQQQHLLSHQQQQQQQQVYHGGGGTATPQHHSLGVTAAVSSLNTSGNIMGPGFQSHHNNNMIMNSNNNNIVSNSSFVGSPTAGAMATSPTVIKQPGDSVNVHALVADADIPALLAQQQQQMQMHLQQQECGEIGGSGTLSSHHSHHAAASSSSVMMSRVVRAIAHDYNNRLLWVAAATETAIVGYSLLGSALEIRHRVGTDGYFATALCVTVAPPSSSSSSSNSGTQSTRTPQRGGGGGGGGGDIDATAAVSLENSQDNNNSSSSALFAKQRAIIDAGSDVLWVGMQDGGIVPISLFFFSERNDRIKYPPHLLSTGSGSSGSAAPPPVESLVGGPNGTLWALHRRSLRSGGGVIALLWDAVCVGRLVASLELLASPGRCFVSHSKNGRFLWAATHVGDNDACTVRCWPETGTGESSSSSSSSSPAALAASGSSTMSGTAEPPRKPQQSHPALFLNTFGSISGIKAFAMGGVEGSGVVAEHAVLSGEGGLLILSHMGPPSSSSSPGGKGGFSALPPVTRAPRGFDAIQVSAFELIPYTAAESPFQLAAHGNTNNNNNATSTNAAVAASSPPSSAQPPLSSYDSQQQHNKHILVVATGFFAAHEPERGAAAGGGGGGRASSESPTQIPGEAVFGEFPRVAILKLSLEQEELEEEEDEVCQEEYQEEVLEAAQVSKSSKAAVTDSAGGTQQQHRQGKEGIKTITVTKTRTFTRRRKKRLLIPTLSLIRIGFDYYFQPSLVTVISRPRTYQGADSIKMLGVVVHSDFQDEGPELVENDMTDTTGAAAAAAAVSATSVSLVALQPTVDEGDWGIPGFIMRGVGANNNSSNNNNNASSSFIAQQQQQQQLAASTSSYWGASTAGSAGSIVAGRRSATGTMREDGSMANFSLSQPQQQQQQQQSLHVASPGSPTPTNHNLRAPSAAAGAGTTGYTLVQQQTPTNNSNNSSNAANNNNVVERERSVGGLPLGATRSSFYGSRVIGAGSSLVPLGPTPTNADGGMGGGDSQPRRISRSPASTPSGASRGYHNIPPIPPQQQPFNSSSNNNNINNRHHPFPVGAAGTGGLTPRSAAVAMASSSMMQHAQYHHHHHHHHFSHSHSHPVVVVASRAAGGGAAANQPPLPFYHFDAAAGGMGDDATSHALAAAAAASSTLYQQQQQQQQQMLEEKLDRILKRVTPDGSILAVSDDLAKLYRSVSGACSAVAAAGSTSKAKLSALESPECVEQLVALATSSEAEFSAFNTYEIKSLRHLLRALAAVALGKLSTANVKQKRSVGSQTTHAYIDEKMNNNNNNNNNNNRLEQLAAVLQSRNSIHPFHQPSITTSATSLASQATIAALESQLKDAVARYEIVAKSWRSLETFVSAATIPAPTTVAGGAAANRRQSQQQQQQGGEGGGGHLFCRLEPVDYLCPTSHLRARMSERLALLTSMWAPPEASLFNQQQQLQELQAQLQRLRVEATLMHAAAARTDQVLTAAGDTSLLLLSGAASVASIDGLSSGTFTLNPLGGGGRRRGQSHHHHSPLLSSPQRLQQKMSSVAADSSIHHHHHHQSQESADQSHDGSLVDVPVAPPVVPHHNSINSRGIDAVVISSSTGMAQEQHLSSSAPLPTSAALSGGGGAGVAAATAAQALLTQRLSDTFMASFKRRQLPSSISQKLHVAVADVSTPLGAAVRLSERTDILAMASSIGNYSADAVSVVMSLRSHVINSLAIPHRSLGKLNEATHRSFFRAEVAMLFRGSAAGGAVGAAKASSPKRGAAAVAGSGSGSAGGGTTNNSSSLESSAVLPASASPPASSSPKDEQELFGAYFETALQRPQPSADVRHTTLSMRSAGLKWLLLQLYATARVFSSLCNQSVAHSFGGLHHEERELLMAQLRAGEYIQRCSTLMEFFSSLAAAAVDTSTDLARHVIDFIGRSLSVASDMTASAISNNQSVTPTGGKGGNNNSSINNNSNTSSSSALHLLDKSHSASMFDPAGALNGEILALLNQIREVIRSEASLMMAAAANGASSSSSLNSSANEGSAQ